MKDFKKVVGRKASEKDFFSFLQQEITKEGDILYVGHLLQRAARLFADRTALICGDDTISYHQLYTRACGVSKLLRDRGVKKKDRVLLFFENSIDFYVGYFGILQIGAIVVPLNVFLKERELAHIANDAQPTLMIASSHLLKPLNKDEIPGLPPIITEKELHEVESISECEIEELNPHDLNVLLYTSGTTGFPKGVMLSSKNIMTNVIQATARLETWEHERMFGVLPLFHSFAQLGCVWLPFFLGFTVIVVPKVDRRSIIKGLEYNPTIVFGVPALYGLFCLMKTAPFPAVRLFVSGGDALPDKIRMAFALLYRRNLCSGYGLTETSPLISIDLEDEIEPTSNVGRPVEGISCSIKDDDDNELPQGQIGQLWVKGDNVMLGYYNAPDLTREVLTDGWLKTGDFAYVDTKGKLVISGRAKDLIVHKGFNIYPQEIENVILGHPNVMRAGVIGKDDVDVGQVPVAYVQLKEAAPGMEKALRELCKKNLAAYKVPREFICMTIQLPTTATGKVDKKRLTTLAE